MKLTLQRFFRRSAYRVGQGMRGRVHKISIIAGGEVSIVIRCGMDEPRARMLAQGTLVEFFKTQAGAPSAPSVAVIEKQPEAAADDDYNPQGLERERNKESVEVGRETFRNLPPGEPITAEEADRIKSKIKTKFGDPPAADDTQ